MNTLNVSAIYVHYEASRSGKSDVLRVFVEVPQAKIDAYRRAHNDLTSKDNVIARILSEWPALSGFPPAHWLCPVTYPDTLPEELQNRQPAFVENGMKFWKI